jgi:hypothetical protein
MGLDGYEVSFFEDLVHAGSAKKTSDLAGNALGLPVSSQVGEIDFGHLVLDKVA